MANMLSVGSEFLTGMKQLFKNMRQSQPIMTVENGIKNAEEGGEVLHQSFFGEGNYITAESAKTAGGTKDNIIKGYTGPKKWYHFNTDVTNEAGEVIGQNTWNGAAIGAGVGAGAIGLRALSGGGVYRDANGNTDIAGIPFV